MCVTLNATVQFGNGIEKSLLMYKKNVSSGNTAEMSNQVTESLMGHK